MKSIIVLSLFFITVHCGLLDGLQDNKEESKKPDLLKKIVKDLKDDGEIVVGALTAPFKKNIEEKKDSTKGDEPKVTEDSAKGPEDSKSKAENTEENVTTPKGPEVAPAGKPEESAAKTEDVSSVKPESEGTTPKNKTDEAPVTPQAK